MSATQLWAVKRNKQEKRHDTNAKQTDAHSAQLSVKNWATIWELRENPVNHCNKAMRPAEGHRERSYGDET